MIVQFDKLYTSLKCITNARCIQSKVADLVFENLFQFFQSHRCHHQKFQTMTFINVSIIWLEDQLQVQARLVDLILMLLVKVTYGYVYSFRKTTFLLPT